MRLGFHGRSTAKSNQFGKGMRIVHVPRDFHSSFPQIIDQLDKEGKKALISAIGMELDKLSAESRNFSQYFYFRI